MGSEDDLLADWDSMQPVGRERWWLPAANRYPLKTLIELRKIALGPGRPPNGTKDAKLASMRRRRKRMELPRSNALFGPVRHFDAAGVPVHRTRSGIEYVALADVPTHIQEPLWLHLGEVSGRLLMPDVGRACLLQDWLAWLKSQEADRA